MQNASTSKEFTLPAGRHTYDFTLVIPDSLGCEHIKQPSALSLSRLVIDSSGIDYAREASAHFVGPLPPSLSDMENVASVRYFLKATVNRTSLLRMNIRVFKPIVFLPPDQEYQGNPKEIMFVRRDAVLNLDGQQQSVAPVGAKDKKGKDKSSRVKAFFGGTNNSFGSFSEAGRSANITFEMRYPGSASFVPVKPELPFKLYAISTKDPETFKTNGSMMLQDLLIKLYATTHTRAQSYQKEATHCLTLLENHNLNIPIDWSKAKHIQNQQYGVSWEWEVPAMLWEKVVIPDFVPPSFTMCNIKRGYTFEVVGGFSGTPGGQVQFVSLIPNITIMSGLSKKANPMMPDRPEKTDGAPPPSYDAVVYEDEYGGNASAAAKAQLNDSQAGASGPVAEGERRTFGQAPGYYENLESLDEKS